MCFSVPMMFELIPFDCSRMVLLAEVSAKWINFDYLSLTSFDFCKSLIAACSQDSRNYCSPNIRCRFKCMSVIHLGFLAYGSWHSLFPISMSPNCKLMSPKHYF